MSRNKIRMTVDLFHKIGLEADLTCKFFYEEKVDSEYATDES